MDTMRLICILATKCKLRYEQTLTFITSTLSRKAYKKLILRELRQTFGPLEPLFAVLLA